jgi:hypothetical protein
MGSVVLWRRRDLASTLILAAVIAGTSVWSGVLLGRSASFQPWLRPVVLVVGVGAALAFVGARLSRRLGRLAPRVAVAALVGAGVAALLGPAAYAVNTASTAHSGSIPTAGPAVTGAGGRGPGGGPGGPGRPGGPRGQIAPGGPGGAVGPPPRATAGGPRNGGPGGLLNAGTPSAALVALLQANADQYTWAGAAVGSNNAAGYQLGSGVAVMAIGGFNGSDPSPTLAQFQQYVAQGRVHYFLGGGGFMANGGSRTSQEIANWVAQNFTATTVDGAAVYDLTARAS